MPMLNLMCTEAVSPELLKELSSAVAEVIRKPEKYVMIVASKGNVLMSGEEGPAAYLEVKSIGGLNREVNNALSVRVKDLLCERVGVAGERVYITFESIERDHWSWNGATFG